MNTINQSINRQAYIGNTAFKASFSDDPNTAKILKEVKYSDGGEEYLKALEFNLGIISDSSKLFMVKIPLKEMGHVGNRYYITNNDTQESEEFVQKTSTWTGKSEIRQIESKREGRTFSSVAEAIYKIIIDSTKLLNVKAEEEYQFITPRLEYNFRKPELDNIEEILKNDRFPNDMRLSAYRAVTKFVNDAAKFHRNIPRDILEQGRDLIKRYKQINMLRISAH